MIYQNAMNCTIRLFLKQLYDRILIKLDNKTKGRNGIMK